MCLTDGKSTLVQVMAWCLRQQAITWANVDPDLWRHVASLGHIELNQSYNGGNNADDTFSAISRFDHNFSLVIGLDLE